MRFTHTLVRTGVALIALAATGCDDATEQRPYDVGEGEPKGVGGKAEAWGSADDARIFDDNVVLEYAALPTSGETKQTPWASSYWPTYKDSINDRWAGAESDSPAKKYGDATGVVGVEDAVSNYYGVDSRTNAKTCSADTDCNADLVEACAKREGATEGRCIPTWFGICHAWAPAALAYAEPEKDVTYNDVLFKINDIKALLTVVHDRVDSKFVSLRCNTAPEDIEYDQYNRPTDTRCRYTNPATYHILLANYLGLRQQGFVEDRTFSSQVWNQPIRSFEVVDQRPVTAAEANELIGVPLSGESVAETNTAAQGEWFHYGPFTVAEGDSINVNMTGNNDADLYVNFAAEATLDQYACRPYNNGSNETCAVPVAAGSTEFYVSVNGYAASSDFSVDIRYGTAESNYVFNANAASFVYAKTDVRYISESDSTEDGNLSADIDMYTATDTYEYILELDADGILIGGEWIGDSKNTHPDFLWLFTNRSATPVAGGAIDPDTVLEIYNMSITAPDLTTVNESGTVAAKAWTHFGPFSGSDLKAVMTGTRDADLYVRRGAQPTADAYDCRPYVGSSNETCTVNGTGEYYVSVAGYAATSDFELEITFAE